MSNASNSSNNSDASSGDGTRPTTSGGVDNIGAGEKFSSHKTQAGESTTGPAPAEAMARKRKTAEGSSKDDSDAYELHEDLTPSPNPESPPKP